MSERSRVLSRPRTSLILAFLCALIPMAPVAPAHAATGGGDYQQVVDITFPMEKQTAARFRDDYDDCRGSCTRRHQATDLMAPLGTPVYAARGGTVSWVSGGPGGPPSYGWMLYVAGDDGRRYAYIHLGTQDGPMDQAYAPGVEPGASVERGQLLGWAGCSGSASCGGGEHLHFEIHDQNVTDPYDYHDHERINPYPSLVAASERGDFPNARRFRDVGGGNPHIRSIERLAETGITQGCGNRSYCPDQAVTRAQMATFLTRAMKLSPPEVTPFTDVSPLDLHARGISSIAAMGITVGCNPPANDRFCPDQHVTRAQLATFLTRARNLQPSGRDFSDTADSVHARSIRALRAAGITAGCNPPTNDRFCPDAPVTRAQMATFLVRAYGL